MKFCEILPELRKNKKIKQKELASLLGFSTNLVCEWEKGRSNPNIETLIKLADIFNCTVDYLIGRENENGAIIVDSENFTQEELQLIENFRAMDKTQKNAILVTARNFAGKNKAESFSVN